MWKQLASIFVFVIIAGLGDASVAQAPRDRQATPRAREARPVWSIEGDTSSSLYMEQTTPSEPLPVTGRRPNHLSPRLARVSLMAVRLPEPRKFARQDLVTIIIREETRADSKSELDVEKDFELEGEISDIPSLQLKDILQMQLRPSSASENPPRVGIEMNRQFEGEGDYRREDSFVGRITARVIDVKPNGLLVLEARKYIKNDEETQMMRLTGTCRAEDVAADNTVLSTQLFDLNLVKEHTGQLRKTTKKGILTNIFEAIFNF